jgi:transposase
MVKYRKWTVAEKRAIVEEYESAPHGSKGAVLRRHGLHSNRVHVWAWRRDDGLLQETRLGKGWQARMTPRTESAEIGRLRGEVRRLEAALAKEQRNRHVAEAAAEALGKASALLQVILESAESPEPEPSPPVPSVPSGLSLPAVSGISSPPV